MRQPAHLVPGTARLITYSTALALVAAGMAVTTTEPGASVTRGGSHSAAAKQSSKKMAAFLSGKAQLSHGLRVRGARIRVETLRGKLITTYENVRGKQVSFPRRLTTSAGGGIFLPTRGLPRRFVVAVQGKSGKKKNGYGTYRAFVDRKQPPTVKVSYGTTAAVATYRLAKGKWSVAKASKRTVAAMRLPSYTRLGFDDRVNPVYVSRKILLAKSGGDIDKIVNRTARAAEKGTKGPKLYKGAGPRAVKGPVGLLPWFGAFRTERPKSSSAQLSGVVGSLLDVFDQASTLYADISAGSTGKQLKTITAQIAGLDDQMDALSQQVSNLGTAEANATVDLVSWVTNATYSTLSSNFTNEYSIEALWSQFEDMQTTPCPDYTDCAASNVNTAALTSYKNALERWGPSVANNAQVPTGSAAYLAANAEDIAESVLDNAGANGLITWAWQNQIAATAKGNNTATSNSGVIPGGLIPLSGGLTAPVSDQAVSLAQYWLAQMQEAGLMAANYLQVCPQGCPNGYPNPLPTPNPSPSPTLSDLSGWPLQVEMLMYNAYAAAQNLPAEVPDGMVLDQTDKMLWANLGQVWVNTGPAYQPQPQVGMTVQFPPPLAGTAPTVTFDASFVQEYPGATISPAQAQALQWLMPTSLVSPQNPQTYAPCNLGDAGCVMNWTSPQLGNSLGNNQASGLLYLTSYANPDGDNYNTQWDYLGALPTGNGPLLQGIAQSATAFYGQAPPLWVYDAVNTGYTVAQGNALPVFNGITGAMTEWSYSVPTLPTGTPNLLLFSPVSDPNCYAWTGLAPVAASSLPTDWVVPTTQPAAKCPSPGSE